MEEAFRMEDDKFCLLYRSVLLEKHGSVVLDKHGFGTCGQQKKASMKEETEGQSPTADLEKQKEASTEVKTEDQNVAMVTEPLKSMKADFEKQMETSMEVRTEDGF